MLLNVMPGSVNIQFFILAAITKRRRRNRFDEHRWGRHPKRPEEILKFASKLFGDEVKIVAGAYIKIEILAVSMCCRLGA